MTSHRRQLAHQTALADARWPHHANHSAVAIDCAVQQASQRRTSPTADRPDSTQHARRARCRSPMPNSRWAATGLSAPLIEPSQAHREPLRHRPVARWTRSASRHRAERPTPSAEPSPPAHRRWCNRKAPNRSHRRSPDPSSSRPATAAPHRPALGRRNASRLASSCMPNAARQARKA